LAIARKIGAAASNSSSSPPPNKVRLPLSAAAVLPEIATSRTEMPIRSPASWSRRAVSGAIVLKFDYCCQTSFGSQNLARSKVHILDRAIVRQAGQQHVDIGGQRRGIRSQSSACVFKCRALGGITVINCDR
jgi:hypothetical protein